ncbi:restriction endonuclease subunit S [Aeromonas enteropelogenes]|uniref:restriction endonuclease subunit S n=1 Tax=Aeromonas enteropelogenes TaxID=29489 RepID=UPI003F7448F0
MKKGWVTKTLGEILEKTETTNPTNKPDSEFDYIDVSSVSNITFSVETTQTLKGKDAPSRARKLVRENDVIFATIRPTLKRIAIVPKELDQQICSTGYCVLRAKPEIDHRFLFYSLFTASFMGQMESLQKGASYPAVTEGEVKAQSFSFPPLPEQQRIVAILDEAFEAIAAARTNTEQNRQNARTLFESYLQSVFSQKGGSRHETTLGRVCTFIGGSQPPKAVFEKEPTTENIRLIQIRDYKSDRNTVYIPRTMAKRFCDAEDVMIGRYGPPLFQILRGLEGAYNVALIKAVPDESRLSRDYLFYFLKHSDILQYVIYHSERAAGQIGVTKETLEPYPIAIPTQLEQERIVKIVSKLEYETQRLESLYQRKIAALDELKQSLLQQAFSGQL